MLRLGVVNPVKAEMAGLPPMGVGPRMKREREREREREHIGGCDLWIIQ